MATWQPASSRASSLENKEGHKMGAQTFITTVKGAHYIGHEYREVEEGKPLGATLDAVTEYIHLFLP